MVMYELSRAMNDTDGIASFPANNWIYGVNGQRILRRTPLRVPLRDAQRGQVFKFVYLFREFRETLYHDDRLGQLSRRHDQRSSGRYSQKQPARDGAATLDLRWSRSSWRIVPTRMDCG